MLQKEVIFTDKAPLPSGGYSQAIKLGQMVYVSGVCPFEVSTGKVLCPEDIAEQTRIVLRYVEIILNEAGTTLQHAVKVTSYINELDHFKLYDQAYREFFTSEPPARCTVEIGKFPAGMCVEIDCIAFIP